MPKVKWGAGDNGLSASEIDGAERQEVQKRYSGPLPTAGTYRFTLRSLKKGTSGAGNDKLAVMAVLDGSWMPNHKQYDGCPIWDHIPIMQSTKERVANFLDAIGATGADLMEKSIADENGVITRLGSVGDPAGILVYINVQRSKPTKEYPDPSLKVGFNGYIAVDDDEDGVAAGDAADDGEEPPF